jgi:nitrite reductase/ring-hydroxylating ferredoxin subunit
VPSIPVGKLADFPRDSISEVVVADYPYAICNVAGTLSALSGVCIHRGGPLGEGQLHDGRVVCPFHRWEFDCVTGEYDFDATKRVDTYEVKLEGEDVFLLVP